MGFQSIRNILKTKLESISSIQEVYEYPTQEFNGFPAAVVSSAIMDAEFETTTENKRNYVFTVYLYQEIESIGVGQARRVIEGVCDDVVESLDKDQLLSGISLPSNETMIIAFPAIPEIVVGEKYIRAEITVNVVISFDIN